MDFRRNTNHEFTAIGMGWQWFWHALIVFLKIEGLADGTTISIDDWVTISEDGVYAILHSMFENIYTESPILSEANGNYLAHPVSGIIYWQKLETVNESKDSPAMLRISPASYIMSPQIVVPYNLTVEQLLEWLIIEPTEDWFDLFQEEMKTMLHGS